MLSPAAVLGLHHRPGPGRRDAAHRRAGGRDQGGVRRAHADRVRRARRGAEVGRPPADRVGRQGGGPAVLPGAELSDQYGELFRDCWWPAVAIVTRLTGDLEIAEDAVQDACALALTKWPAEGVPSSPRGWLVGVARHKALDRLRREARRAPLEAAAVRDRSEERRVGKECR